VPLLDLVETVYAALARSSPAPHRLARLLGDDAAVDCFFKRALFLDVAGFLSVATLAARPDFDRYARIVVDRRWPGSEVFASLLVLWRRDRLSGVDGLSLPPPVTGALDRLELERSRRARPLLSAARTATLAWLRLLRRVRPLARRPARAPLLVHTFASDFGIDFGGLPRLRNVDFVVDGERVRRADIVFWAEPGQPQERLDALAGRGYRVVTRRDVPLAATAFIRSTLPGLLRLTPLLFTLARERWWLRHAADAGSTYLLWRQVVQAFAPRAFLVVNDLFPSSAIRNLALRQGGCTTVQYQHSCHWRPSADGWIRDYVFAFAFVDAVVTWGPAHSAHVLAHSDAIGATWETGCIWSEHARLCADDAVLSGRYRALLEDHVGRPLEDFERRVAVFDTSVSLLDEHDLASFEAGVGRLAHRLPNVLFLFKPKNAEAPSPPSRNGHPRNLVRLPNLFETAATVGLTELSISACFTSTAVEGMGCGRPALFYDPTERFPQTFWRRIPGLVCTTDDELYERVAELLWSTSPEEHLAYLREHCSDLEGRFDGRALTRLRTRLGATLQP
jgi:hypothetical protein